MNTPNKPIWRKTNLQGLYEYRPAGLPESERGTYYSRYSLGGKRTFRSLETSVFEHARIKHAQRSVDVEKDRQRGADLGTQFKTLGALFAEMQLRLDASPVAASTEVGRRNNMTRLRDHWQKANFDTFLARGVTADIVVNLREHLLKSARWSYHFGKNNVGFGVGTTNQTLWVLRVMLDIAVEKKVIVESPFKVSSALRGTLFASARTRGASGACDERVQLPTREDMGRLFAEMRRLPESENFRPNELQRVWLAAQAVEMADHAELLAFSGMRRDEATRSTLGDDRGTEFKIWGTKSRTSERTIPVNPALRQVLDRIKTRRVGDKTKLVVHAEPRTALKRACKRLGLPTLRNHDLRHFFASVCIASGVDVPTVSRWLGHADGGALAMRTYSHLMKDASQAAAAKVDFNGPTAQAIAV
ncbi:MAG: site-specific integrase [Verrucomicrobia bacterium]|nr:site-specific integrase [Verrucomicrobiota bacterium]